VVGEWKHVNKKQPCPICKKPDWCLVHIDGNAVICPRTPDGATKDLGNAGFLHLLGGSDNTRRNLPGVAFPRPIIDRSKDARLQRIELDWEEIVSHSCDRIYGNMLEKFGESLGVTGESLDLMEVGKTLEGNWTFPMKRADGKRIGVRIRAIDSSRKWSWKHSRTGLFIPLYRQAAQQPRTVLLICEGPTDVAAALDLGFDAVGRPSCTGGVDMLMEFVRHGQKVCIIGDRDSPGMAGAKRLADVLATKCRLKMIVPHYTNDIREWLQGGATHEKVMKAIQQAEEF